VFLKDMQTGEISLVSTASNGTQANHVSDTADISDNGRYVAFISTSTNLVPGYDTEYPDVFVKDVETGLTVRVSSTPEGNQTGGRSFFTGGGISADGRFVAFVSTSQNLLLWDEYQSSYDDTFVASNPLADPGGIDEVRSSVDFTLGSHLENLTLTGTADIDGAGNSLDNLLLGNAGANLLRGGKGNDTLNGGGGIDGAIFSGNRSQYTLTEIAGTWTISGPDGIDTLTAIEFARFADQALSLSRQRAALHDPLSISLETLFNDIGDSLSFGASSMPTGLVINPLTGQISGTAAGAIGTHSITVTATDPSNALASLSFDLTLTTSLTAQVLTRGGIPLPGVIAHHSAGPNAGQEFSLINLGASGQQQATLNDSRLKLFMERGTSDYLINGTAKPVSAADALDALKLSVNISGSTGNTWKELIAADINKDGRVTAGDALEILKISVGINTLQPSWVFVPEHPAANPDLGTMTRSAVTYANDLHLTSISAPIATTFTGILVGDVNNSWMIPG